MMHIPLTFNKEAAIKYKNTFYGGFALSNPTNVGSKQLKKLFSSIERNTTKPKYKNKMGCIREGTILSGFIQKKDDNFCPLPQSRMAGELLLVTETYDNNHFTVKILTTNNNESFSYDVLRKKNIKISTTCIDFHYIGNSIYLLRNTKLQTEMDTCICSLRLVNDHSIAVSKHTASDEEIAFLL